MRKSNFLSTFDGKSYLLREYQEKGRSPYEIAKELGVYPLKVRLALIAHNIPVRNKSEAQIQALKSGRSKHPKRKKDNGPS